MSGNQGFCFPNKKRNRVVLVPFRQVKRQDFTVTMATKIGAVMCDARFKQQGYPSFVWVCIIYSLLLLKTSASHHFALVERQQVANHIMVASVDTKAFWQLIWAANSLNRNRKSSGSLCSLPWTVGNVLLSADASMTRYWPCCLGSLYGLWRCWVSVSIVTPSLYVTDLAPGFQNISTSTIPTPRSHSGASRSILLWKSSLICTVPLKFP